MTADSDKFDIVNADGKTVAIVDDERDPDALKARATSGWAVLPHDPKRAAAPANEKREFRED